VRIPEPRRLRALLTALATQWALELGEPWELSFHAVVPVRTRDGADAVLKVVPPAAEYLERSAVALTGWAGAGAVRLLRADLPRGALLLERALPGTQAAALVPGDDEGATAAAIGVLHRLHAATVPERGLPGLPERLAAFDDHLGDPSRVPLLPRPLVERARAVAGELLADPRAPVLLHGDLHHANVLRAQREDWLAIDPHGLVGDPGYDAGAWLYNPEPGVRDRARVALVPRRVEQLADGLGQPVERIAAWGFVQAVLSAVWTASSGLAPRDRTLDVAALLLPRLP
jgi:streptomycin 6-kinase